VTATDVYFELRDRTGQIIFAGSCDMIDSLATCKYPVHGSGNRGETGYLYVEPWGPKMGFEHIAVDMWHLQDSDLELVLGQVTHRDRTVLMPGSIHFIPTNITVAAPKKCSCTMRTIMMRGCQCGGS
jgi:hypothetical protein